MKKKICLFGTYDYNYSRNSSIRDGLRSIGVKVSEAHYNVPMTQLETKADFTVITSFKRIVVKLTTWFRLLTKWRSVYESDAVLVLHPGHLDLPLAWIMCKLFGKPLIFDTSISPYDTMIQSRNLATGGSLKERLLWWVEKILLTLPDKLFTDTQGMSAFLQSTFAISENRLFAVPIGANTNVYQPQKVQKKSKNKVQVLFFGMYNPLHGAWQIVRAANRLKRDTQIEFLLIGDGPIKKDLIDYATKNQLKNVSFKGFMPEQALVQHINAADILLGTFSNDPIMQRVIPNKTFGALACKKCVITARQPVLEEYFTHEQNIYFTKPEDDRTLSDAIRKLAADQNSRNKIAEAGYQVFSNIFTPEKIGQALLTGIFYPDFQKPSTLKAIYLSILANVTKPQTQVQQSTAEIFDYHLQKQLSKKSKLNNFAIGIYTKSGKDFFVKTWHKKSRDLSFYSAVNEFRVGRILFQKFAQFNLEVRVPQPVEIVIQANGAYSFVYQYVQGKSLAAYSQTTRQDYLQKIITALEKISNHLSASEKKSFNQRGLLFYVISLPLLTLFAIRINPSQWLVLTRACLRCLTHIRPSKEKILAHRDLHPNNVKIKGDTVYLLDSEDMVLTIPGFDQTDLNISHPDSEIDGCNEFLKLYIAIHRAGNVLRANHYRDFLFRNSESSARAGVRKIAFR
ncbi:glycosyltransferase [Candidatus Microgenomates bacterium]|nr:MAG: glycosyltransferase [Candidatus Microgenomates bacterium]